MNRGTIFAFGAFIGAAIGSGITYLSTKKRFDTVYDSLRRKDFEEATEHFEKKYQEFVDKVMNGEIDLNEDEDSQFEGGMGEEFENGGKSTSQNASVTHQKARRAILGYGDDEEVTNSEKMAENANKRSTGHVDYSKIKPGEKTEFDDYEGVSGEIDLKPFVIMPREFDMGDFEKVELHYYRDDVLTDDMDEPVDEDELFPNIDVYTAFDIDTEEEPDLLYIRDPKLKLDYEIQKILMNYPGMDESGLED